MIGISDGSSLGLMIKVVQVDCATNLHTQGCHLLCHDDVIGTRKVCEREREREREGEREREREREKERSRE